MKHNLSGICDAVDGCCLTLVRPSCSFREWTSLHAGFCPLTDSWVWHFTSRSVTITSWHLCKIQMVNPPFFFAIHSKHLQKSFPPLWCSVGFGVTGADPGAKCPQPLQKSTPSVRNRVKTLWGVTQRRRGTEPEKHSYSLILHGNKGKVLAHMCMSGCKCAVADASLTLSNFKSHVSALIFSPPPLQTSGKTEESWLLQPLPPSTAMSPSISALRPFLWFVRCQGTQT